MIIIERTDPHRCCARCGIEPKEVRKYGTKCSHWGVTYDHHYWIDWTPASRDTLSLESALQETEALT